MNDRLLILVGPSNSGKSTFARNFCADNENTYIVSRDSERLSLFGKYRMGSNSEESMINVICHNKILSLAKLNKNIVVDNTHLRPKYIKELVERYNKLYDIQILFMDDVGLEELILREMNRRTKQNKTIPTTVIEKQYKQFQELKKYWKHQEFPFFFPKDTKI